MNKALSLKNERGASSILVIIMMVVLLVFGLAILTTSLSNLRLSERKKDWLNEYYLLEGQVVAEVAAYDHLLIEAETEAKLYMESQGYLEDYLINQSFITDDMMDLFYYEQYALLATSKIEAALSNKEDVKLSEVNEFSWENSFQTQGAVPFQTLTFSTKLADSSYDKHIQVTMAILAPTKNNRTEDFQLLERYIITQHTQQQEAFKYDDAIDFGNPFGDDAEGNNTQGNPFAEDPFQEE